MSEFVAATTTETFDADVLESKIPVLVDFWAPWCSPCTMVAPVLDDYAAQNKERLKILKVDIDQYPELAQRFQVRGIPALLVFRDGLLQGTKIGALTRSQLSSFLDPHLG